MAEAGARMRLAELIHPDAVVTELEATDRDGAIRELAAALVESGAISADQLETVVREAIARENQGTTGCGKGVAVPHVKLENMDQQVATIGCSSHGLDFQSLDRAPVYTVLMLVSPKDRPEDHIGAMETIFGHLLRENFRRFLRQADSKEAILEVIQDADELGDDS